jgi:putative transposase
VNHQISKKIVDKALRHRLAIALEDLKGIRERTTVKKAKRRQHHSWAFYQLRQFILYKAKRAGIPVFLVDSKNTRHTTKT